MPRSKTQRNPALKNESIEDNAAQALHSSITLMQDLLVRVVALADEGKNLKELLQILETVGKTSNRLSLLLKNQKQLGGGENLADFLNQALAEVVQEMGDGTEKRKNAAV
ncbi:hypothetical protein [Leptolinea tardivitalis]|uniref:Uncharacterized protein n=1 Tax=Leptolinea tardivitalis TaxID=229920 RepID=A0A0P6WWX2_9CHLR|nr:hypothetical protein [Leptolinea tardivitalis]KPL70617.1 hypothetical protein ADM99_16065 [Leptolinea tardivitalis]GAP22236.1 hypothetical protein LTAR_02461 [Leptolinea tardivitalis]